MLKGASPTTVPQLCHSREGGNPEILVRSLIAHLLDSRLRGNDTLADLDFHVHSQLNTT